MAREIKFSRVVAGSRKETFKIKPIAELLNRYVGDGKGWADPYAGDNSPAQWTNDHNPEKNTGYHMEAKEFCELMVPEHPGFQGALFDPPYSYRQVSEHYKVRGKKATRFDTSNQFYNRVMNPLCEKIRQGGYAISFGWNSNGFGARRGFEIIEIMLVAHGQHKHDTIVTVEEKV
ncbi:MAG: hypothetical protein M0Q91_17840 [Methanoregula sp.]|jgi:hypothetical protein|nr:hypothetical protein [Methanoregula sp.]